MKDTPIFITVKDRLSMFTALVNKLTSQGYDNIHIVDTGSTWGPMVDYLASTKYPIHRAPADMPSPHLALWHAHIIDGSSKIKDWYVETDCDVVPDCPDDWLYVLRSALEIHTDYPKAGLGLRIDDLPNCYNRKAAVIECESKFWEPSSVMISPGLFDSQIDTTLALYRPGVWWGEQGMRAIRTDYPYVAKHLPWYSDSSNLSAEERYYREHMNPTVGSWKP